MTVSEEDLEPETYVYNDMLVEYHDECTCANSGPLVGTYSHEPGCGMELLANLSGMSVTERIAVVLDPTSALGTPEVMYRRLLGESTADAAVRLKAEVMRKAENIWRVVQSSLPE